jgi:alkylation response protein AidB-like acyl-CoA dehydrogenase
MPFSTTSSPEIIGRAEALVPLLSERAGRYDREGRFPAENFVDLHKAGLLGVFIPPELGGLGASYQTFAAVARTLARGCGSTAMCWVMHAAGTLPVAVAGTPEQHRRYLEPVVREGKLFSVAYSEPGSGSNFLAPQMVARRATDGDGRPGYRLSGDKFFVTSAGAASFFLINTAVEDPAPGKAMNVFVVALDEARSVTVRSVWDAMGMRGNSSNDLVFDGCFLPDDARLGEHAAGISVMRLRPGGVPMGLAAIPVGLAEAALADAIEHARTRVLAHTGKPLSHLQAIRFPIAEMQVAVDAARLLVERAARLADEQPAAAMLEMVKAKYLSNTTAVEVCTKALQVCGGRGYHSRSPVQRYLRDAHAGGLMATTLETGRDFVAKILLGLDPAGPE